MKRNSVDKLALLHSLWRRLGQEPGEIVDVDKQIDEALILLGEKLRRDTIIR